MERTQRLAGVILEGMFTIYMLDVVAVSLTLPFSLDIIDRLSRSRLTNDAEELGAIRQTFELRHHLQVAFGH